MKNGLDPRQPADITISLHTASCHLESSYIPFIEYARSYLKGLTISPKGKPVVKSRLFWGERPGKNWSGAVYSRGRRLLQHSSGISSTRLLLAEIIDLPGLQIETGWQDDTLLVDAYYSPESRLARAAGRFNPFLPRTYVILIYYLVYFPLFYSLYLNRGWHLFHAGAVENDGSGWIFAGLPGSGKSTFTLSLLSRPGVKLLSDNLLMFDENRVYACPEPLHLGRESIEIVDKAVSSSLYDSRRKFSHERRDYRLGEDRRSWGIEPKSLLFLGLAEKSAHRRLTGKLALERLAGFDRMAKEVNAYEQFAASLDLLVSEIEAEPTGRISTKKITLTALMSRMDCWELWIKKGEDLSQSWKWLEDLFEDRDYKNEIQSEGFDQNKTIEK